MSLSKKRSRLSCDAVPPSRQRFNASCLFSLSFAFSSVPSSRSHRCGSKLIVPHKSPLYLAFFTYVIPISSRALTILLWTMADLISALALSQIWQTRRTRSGEKVDRLDKEAMITSLYVFSIGSSISLTQRPARRFHRSCGSRSRSRNRAN